MPYMIEMAHPPDASGGSSREARCALPVHADLRIVVADGESGATLCRLWIHPLLEPLAPSFVLAHDNMQSELDLVDKRALQDGFTLSLRFSDATAKDLSMLNEI